MDRGKHYTYREKEDVLDIIGNFKNIIENKKTDGVSIEEKNNAWKKIVNGYNSLNPSTGPRTVDQLRMLYKNLKRKARSDKARDRAEAFKTGGGIYTPKTDDLENKIIEIIKDQIDPLPNKFDSNAEYMFEVSNVDRENTPDALNSILQQESHGLETLIVEYDHQYTCEDGSGPSSEQLPKKRRVGNKSKYNNFIENVTNFTQTKNKQAETRETIILKMKQQQYENELLRKKHLEEEHKENLRLVKLKQKNELLAMKLLRYKLKQYNTQNIVE